jgi:hypothetical protein
MHMFAEADAQVILLFNKSITCTKERTQNFSFYEQLFEESCKVCEQQ